MVGIDERSVTISTGVGGPNIPNGIGSAINNVKIVPRLASSLLMVIYGYIIR